MFKSLSIYCIVCIDIDLWNVIGTGLSNLFSNLERMITGKTIDKFRSIKKNITSLMIYGFK